MFGVVKRFSEDIDLTIQRDALGGDDPTLLSGNAQRRAIESLTEKCGTLVSTTIFQGLEDRFNEILTEPDWRLNLDGSETINFEYPSAEKTEYTEYLKPVIRLEFGCKGEVHPSNVHQIQPYVAEVFESEFTTASCSVNVLDAERTFWEKVTLLHGVCCRGEMKERSARHYYDVFKLATHQIGTQALSDLRLLRQVVDSKKLFFRQASAKYQDAVSGGLLLIPSGDLKRRFQQDYDSTREELIYGEEAPDFDTVLEKMEEIQNQINESCK